MNWSRVPTLGSAGYRGLHAPVPAKSSYLSEGGEYRVSPVFRRSARGGWRTKQTAWVLTEGGKRIGMPFHTAKLAKAFAECLHGLDAHARVDFIRYGGAWALRQERLWRLDRQAEPTPFSLVEFRPRNSLIFRWWGGAYITVSTYRGVDFEVINVWDVEADKPTIRRTQSAFEREVRSWLANPETDIDANLEAAGVA